MRIPYKYAKLTLTPSNKGCWGCYFLSEQMGCHCPSYLECENFKIFTEVEKAKLSDVVCQEDNKD